MRPVTPVLQSSRPHVSLVFSEDDPEDARLLSLVASRPGPEGEGIREWIASADLSHVPRSGTLRSGPVSPVNETALRAGLFLWADFLDEAHGLAQSLEGERLADHWHAVLHRREPDYSNAKYWFRRVPAPAWYGALLEHAREVLPSAVPSAGDQQRMLERLVSAERWDPLLFVDLCERAGLQDSPLDIALRRIQRREMQLLLAECL